MIVGILLAAGRGSRFGAQKLLAPLAGIEQAGAVVEAVGERACRNACAALPRVIAVVRPGEAELSARLARSGAEVVEFPGADAGMGASLARGIAETPGCDGWVVALADMPFIEPSTIARVASALADGAALAAPFYGGHRGHPVGFGREFEARLLGLAGDEGARGVVRGNAHRLQRIVVDDPGILRDIDRPGDLGPGHVGA